MLDPLSTARRRGQREGKKTTKREEKERKEKKGKSKGDNKRRKTVEACENFRETLKGSELQ